MNELENAFVNKIVELSTAYEETRKSLPPMEENPRATVISVLTLAATTTTKIGVLLEAAQLLGLDKDTIKAMADKACAERKLGATHHD